MLIENGDGTYLGGPLDVWCILKRGDHYHPAFLEERPMPGPIQNVDELTVVRLQSKMHHTTGFDTLDAALASLDENESKKIEVPPENIWREPREWDGEVFVTVVPNWRRRQAA